MCATGVLNLAMCLHGQALHLFSVLFLKIAAGRLTVSAPWMLSVMIFLFSLAHFHVVSIMFSVHAWMNVHQMYLVQV